MDERIARLRTPTDARTFAKNALKRGRPDLETEALAHARALQAIQDGHTSPAQQAIATALYAYEEAQSQLKGRTFRANRTRKMITDHGALHAAERMVVNRKPSKGYEVLEDAGLQELSFEAIIVRFPHEFSERAIQAAQARLDGRPPPTWSSSDNDVAEKPRTSRVLFDAEARGFLDGFSDPLLWFRTNWLPRYRTQTQTIAQDLADNRLGEAFDILWKRVRNDISNAGQGVVKYDTVAAMHDDFIQVLREIYADGSPENYEQIVERFEGWKSEGRIDKVPRLLIARAFAGVHPHRYHTTVDAKSQNQVLEWFVEHTGFVMPRMTGWAHCAEALVNHLDGAEVFGGDQLARNIFPWFVLEQLRARSAAPDLKPGHSPRPSTAFADLPASRRIIELRHNQVQGALFTHLENEFGPGSVWTEYPSGTGGFADAYVRLPDTRCYLYEIKIADTAAQVVRQAMGQLLEYSYRTGGLESVKLFAVGEPDLDEVTRCFLERLRGDFHLDIAYLQIRLPDDGQCP
ncbi:hypothetical protein HBF26_12100 [Luteibacter jiangsuensis]|uniref:Uncharacterized protein n=1 Tax=Luteibacter jiangsuensis TaxID=637577 RepID=A0ABX0Q529_9GAMM|nr:hypothetical protein [Luteibacter jiangsuensis]NID05633.1 hypothetical protein [Luteibacter jiangsuensis]